MTTAKKKKLKLTDERSYFKPFTYPQFYDKWLEHEQGHWTHQEVPLNEDVYDWKHKLSDGERSFLTNIFRFFTQGDIDVAGAYVKNYLPVFPQPEVRMMLLGFAARECVHIAGYSHLIETLGMPDSIYNEFLNIEAMAKKHQYVENFVGQSNEFVAQQLAVFSAFTEGMQLFSTFIMLLNYPRHGVMKGTGQIVTWSLKDESKHVDGMVELFRVMISENRHIWTDALKKQLYQIAEEMVKLEDAFIDYSFGAFPQRNLTAEEVKQYIRYIADRRLLSLGLKPIFKVKRNPLPWVEEYLNAPTLTNFFENRVVDYSKGAHTGSWDDVWESVEYSE